MAHVNYRCPDCEQTKDVEVPEYMLEEHHKDTPQCDCGEWMEVDND
jgi:hypothetical protein